MFESFRPSPYSALMTSCNLGKLQGLSHSNRQTCGGGGASPACDSITLSSREFREGTGLSAWACGVRVWGVSLVCSEETLLAWSGGLTGGSCLKEEDCIGKVGTSELQAGSWPWSSLFLCLYLILPILKWSQNYPISHRKVTVISYELGISLLAYRRAFRLLLS